MVHITCKLTHWDLKDTRVILRADLNVPLAQGKLLNDFRLQALKPTLDYLLERKATVILLTHIGRPSSDIQSRSHSMLREASGQATQESIFSTRHLIPWFTAHNYQIQFAHTITDAVQATSNLILLENLRFWPEEQEHSPEFARELAQLGTYYVNDAFGVMHRTDTSVTLLPQEFSPNHRSIGFLVERELKALQRIKENPESPFIAILGGGKVHDKIPLLEKLIPKSETILLCPAIVFTFEKARGRNIGKSFVDEESLAACRTIMDQCAKHEVKLIFPLDYQVALNTLNGPLSFVAADAIPEHAIGVSIGPKTITLFSEAILNARTIFFNGVFGFLERKETLEGVRKLIELIAQSQATSIVAGGDTSAAAQAFGFLNDIDYVSTGGGATLAYITNQELPGLTALVSA